MKTILTWKVSWKSFQDSLRGLQPHFESLVRRLKWLLPKEHSVSSGINTAQVSYGPPLTGRQISGRIILRRVSWRLKQDWNLQPSTPECSRSFLVLWEIPHWLSRGESDMNAVFLFCFVFSEISDNTSEMDEGKRPQEPPSAPPRITHGKGEGSQVSQCIIRNPSLELLYSASVFLSCLFIIAAPESPSRYFFLIMNATPQGILIT